jgi:hypothetical protein
MLFHDDRLQQTTFSTGLMVLKGGTGPFWGSQRHRRHGVGQHSREHYDCCHRQDLLLHARLPDQSIILHTQLALCWRMMV